jgi:serine/threonine protein kinase
VLINDIGRAMLTDFGTVVVGELTTAKLTTTQTPAGNRAWTAPEILDVDPVKARLRRKNGAVDVFAFGRMCLSVSTPDSIFNVLYNQSSPLAML